jgi:hypothetical protein
VFIIIISKKIGVRENMRFSVEKLEIVSDHLSTRYYIKDNNNGLCYDVRHMVSEGYEIQNDTWAENICTLLNNQEHKLTQVLQDLDVLEQTIMELQEKYKDDPCVEILNEVVRITRDKKGVN